MERSCGGFKEIEDLEGVRAGGLNVFDSGMVFLVVF